MTKLNLTTTPQQLNIPPNFIDRQREFPWGLVFTITESYNKFRISQYQYPLMRAQLLLIAY